MAPLQCALKAPAKVNLSLHIEGRRLDGYHQLSGLVAFSTVADEVHIELSGVDKRNLAPGHPWSFEVTGPFAAKLQDPQHDPSDNLVLRAARLFCAHGVASCGGSILLHKKLPIASGLGGGSSDAAATLNVLQILCASPFDEHLLARMALELGADVPMCLTPTAQFVSGIGERRQIVEAFPELPAVLVNPRVSVATGKVFHELNAPALQVETAIESICSRQFQSIKAVINYLSQQRNDLQKPAIRMVPIIGDVLALLEQDNGCRLARMSGSGATCFGLYERQEQARQAAKKISSSHPDWWVEATVLS